MWSNPGRHLLPLVVPAGAPLALLLRQLGVLGLAQVALRPARPVDVHAPARGRAQGPTPARGDRRGLGRCLKAAIFDEQDGNARRQSR